MTTSHRNISLNFSTLPLTCNSKYQIKTDFLVDIYVLKIKIIMKHFAEYAVLEMTQKSIYTFVVVTSLNASTSLVHIFGDKTTKANYF